MDRLRQRADFLAVANGARVNSTAFTLQSRRREDLGPIRVGFTVTRKNGNAPERNRIRRRLREAARELEATGDFMAMRPHHDYVLVGRRAALTCDFGTILDDLRSALQRLDRQDPKRQSPKREAREPRAGSNDETQNET
ncbi:MAG: ribonuclease P protein component [Bradyrhizobium sp.]|nr:ribonuclease P protein component [Bradyrhizobium sp.]